MAKEMDASSDSEECPPPRKAGRLVFIRPKGSGGICPTKNSNVRVERWPPKSPEPAPIAPPAQPQRPFYPVACEYPFLCCPPYVLCPYCMYGQEGGPKKEVDDEEKTSKAAPAPGTATKSSKSKGHKAKSTSKSKAQMAADESGDSEDGDGPPTRSPHPPGPQGWDGVKIHYCYRCGKFRSKSFHHANPLMPGGKPLVGLCSRCKQNPPLHSPFGYCSGRIVGERVILRPANSRRSHWSKEDEPREDRKRSGKPKSKPSRPEPRIVELSSSSSSSESHHSEEKDEPAEAPKESVEGKEKDKCAQPPVRIVRIIERGSSRHARLDSRYDDSRTVECEPDEEQLKKEAAERRRREIDRRIASHPHAWARGRMVPVERQPHNSTDRSRCPTRDPQPPPSQPHTSPVGEDISPEWIYRHVTRRVIRNPYRSPCSEDDEPDIDQSTEPHESHIRTDRTRPRRSHRIPQEDKPVQSSRSTIPNHDRFRFREDPPYSRPKRRHSSSESPPPRVHFSADTKDENNEKPRRSPPKGRVQSEAEDKAQEERDKQEYDARKKRVRHKVHKGAGAFEIDGHQSDDPASSKEDSYGSANHKSAHSMSFEYQVASPTVSENSSGEGTIEDVQHHPRTAAYVSDHGYFRLHNHRVHHECSKKGICCRVQEKAFEQVAKQHNVEASEPKAESTNHYQLRPSFNIPQLKRALSYELRASVDSQAGNNLAEQPQTRMYRFREAGCSFKSVAPTRRSSGFTTPTALLLVDDPVSPGRLTRTPSVMSDSIFDHSWDSLSSKRHFGHARRISSSSTLPGNSGMRPRVFQRHVTEEPPRRMSEMEVTRSARVAEFQKYLERNAQDVPKRQRSADPTHKYRAAMHEYHRQRSKSDPRRALAATSKLSTDRPLIPCEKQATLEFDWNIDKGKARVTSSPPELEKGASPLSSPGHAYHHDSLGSPHPSPGHTNQRSRPQIALQPTNHQETSTSKRHKSTSCPLPTSPLSETEPQSIYMSRSRHNSISRVEKWLNETPNASDMYSVNASVADSRGARTEGTWEAEVRRGVDIEEGVVAGRRR